jgi:hypothetical protein
MLNADLSPIKLTAKTGQALELEFVVEGEDILAILSLPATGEVREQTIWQPGCKPFAPNWRASAMRRMAKGDKDNFDVLSPLIVIPSAMKIEA